MFLKQLSHSLLSTLTLSGGGDYVIIGGRKYHYVKIGNQLWLAENLDYKWNGLIIDSQGQYTGVPKATYPNGDEATYGQQGNKYGLLYNWFALKYLDDNKRTLLPDGWRVPTVTDYSTLSQFIGSGAGKKLKSISGWNNGGNGTDDYGFTGVPAGYFFGSFYSLGQYSWYGTVTQIGSYDFYFWYLQDNNDNINQSSVNKSYRVSLRLTKDV